MSPTMRMASSTSSRRSEPDGKLLRTIEGGKTKAGSFSPSTAAVNSSGDLYVADYAHGVVDEFAPIGTGRKIVEDNRRRQNQSRVLLSVHGRSELQRRSVCRRLCAWRRRRVRADRNRTENC